VYPGDGEPARAARGGGSGLGQGGLERGTLAGEGAHRAIRDVEAGADDHRGTSPNKETANQYHDPGPRHKRRGRASQSLNVDLNQAVRTLGPLIGAHAIG
jgi:hypothetical protein